MGNIITYLNEFRNVSLRKMPFNEIDNLVLCTLAYNNFENIIPENAEYSISVKKAAKLFVKMKHHSFIPKTEQILFKMSCKRRFSRAKLFNYVNFVDSNIGIQFCAFHILLNDKTTFIVFRGTDESLTGWKESFCISCENIPSCHVAAKYLKTTIKPGKIYRIGGHSKGGYLAEAAYIMCPKQLQSQITAVYSNDGPGFSVNTTHIRPPKSLFRKLTKIVPEYNIIGSLFENMPPTMVVKTNKPGILSHDALTWEISENHFVTAKKSNIKSRLISKACHIFINSLNLSQRKKLIEKIFSVLKKSGIINTINLTHRKVINSVLLYFVKKIKH